MGNGIIWFWLSCKRQIKKISFLAVLVLIPVLLTAVSKAEQGEDGGIKVGLYADGGLGMETAEKLTKLSGAFSFYIAGSEEDLKEDVETGRAECGYVFPEDLREKLENGDFRRCIQLYSSPSTVLGMMTEEVVFSAMMEVYSPEILKSYSESQSWDAEAIGNLYEKYSSNGSTFSFEYETAAGAALEKNTFSITFPGRGIGAVFLFITAIFAAAGLAEDEKKGLFLCIPQGKKHRYVFLAVLAPVILECAVILLSLYLTGTALKGPGGLIKEIGAMAVYGIGTAAFAALLKGILKKQEILIGTVPFFMIGSLALCPVFVDAGRWIPQLAVFGKIFLPYYYLQFFL